MSSETLIELVLSMRYREVVNMQDKGSTSNCDPCLTQWLKQSILYLGVFFWVIPKSGTKPKNEAKQGKNYSS